MECTPVWFLSRRNYQIERTHSCRSICLFSGMSDSEVSPEAELGKTSAKHPQGDCLEAEEVLNEDVKEESVDGSKEDAEDDEMYDIDIDTDDEHTERKDQDVRREDGVSWSGHKEACSAAARMSGSVDDEEHRIKREAEAPEDREESHTELKVMFLSFWIILPGFVSVCGCFGGGGGLIPVKNIYFQCASDKISMVLTGCIFFSFARRFISHLSSL